jgi:hypothetical protein
MLIALNRDRFNRYMRQAGAAYGQGEYLEAAAMLQIAAGCAWRRHCGFFFSAQLEEMLIDISAKIAKEMAPIPRRKKRQGPKVLHILTQAHAVGGHTRLVCNWIEADRANEHHVVLTQQGIVKIPERISSVARNSGGSLHQLHPRGGLLRNALSLRILAMDYDFIALHINPDDVVPILAFGSSPERPPVAYLNHADHVFWIGSTICDVNLNLRESGKQLSVVRRGIPWDRNLLLPIPLLGAGEPMLARASARSALSLKDTDIVILTVASQNKFLPQADADFAEVHMPILQRHRNVKFIVVGPSPSQQYWHRWSRATDGRLEAVGIQADTRAVLAAADIYCDSFPMGSLTSLLEAGLVGIPCVSWRPYAQDSLAAVLSCDDVSFREHQLVFNDKAKYIQRLEFLVELANRADLGGRLKQSILHEHTGVGWAEALQSAYEACRDYADRRPHKPSGELGPVGEYDEILASFQEAKGPFVGPLSRSLPISIRVRQLLARGAGAQEVAKAIVPAAVIRALR